MIVLKENIPKMSICCAFCDIVKLIVINMPKTREFMEIMLLQSHYLNMSEKKNVKEVPLD